MKIAVKLAFDEMGALRLLNWLAQENAIIHKAQPDLPLLYDSGVVYRREEDETWCDYLNMLARIRVCIHFELISQDLILWI